MPAHVPRSHRESVGHNISLVEYSVMDFSFVGGGFSTCFTENDTC